VQHVREAKNRYLDVLEAAESIKHLHKTALDDNDSGVSNFIGIDLVRPFLHSRLHIMAAASDTGRRRSSGFDFDDNEELQ